jgi:hypothetical protein
MALYSLSRDQYDDDDEVPSLHGGIDVVNNGVQRYYDYGTFEDSLSCCRCKKCKESSEEKCAKGRISICPRVDR